jgi:hypothetical protein
MAATLSETWIWLEALPMAARIGESAWFPFLESVHVLAATFLIGSILMVDLRLIGVAARQYGVSQIVREVVPWTYGACAVSLATGFALFMTRASHYAQNIAFEIKMLLLVGAGLNMAVFHLVTRRDVARWDAKTSAAAKFAGGCSLVLWIGVTLAGRWIGHLS